MTLRFRSLLVAAVLAFPGLACAADFLLVAHPGLAETALSKDDVKNILLGTKTKWDSGPVVKLAVLSEGPAAEAAVQAFTARTADQFGKYWKKQVFTGKGVSPDTFKADADLLAFVAKTPGAFGFVSGSADVSSVKTITVN